MTRDSGSRSVRAEPGLIPQRALFPFLGRTTGEESSCLIATSKREMAWAPRDLWASEHGLKDHSPYGTQNTFLWEWKSLKCFISSFHSDLL